MSITIVEMRPDSPEAVELISELDAHLDEQPYTPESRHAFSVERLLREQVAFFVARDGAKLAGCGGIKLFGTEYGEVKRMFVRPDFRGRGLGKEILNALSEYALANDISLLRLETGIYQIEAIGLYERYGFERRGPFGEYRVDPMSVYFEKSLT